MNKQDIFYLTLAQEPDKTQTAVSLRDRAAILWCEVRDTAVEERAKHIVAHVPESRLLSLFSAVATLVDTYVGDWEMPIPEDTAHWVASGLACLNWHFRWEQGREYEFDLSVNEVERWMSGTPETQQLSLFPGW